MARTALYAGLLALAVAPGLAEPMSGVAPPMEAPEWEAATVDAEKVESVETLTTDGMSSEPMPSVTDDAPTPLSEQDAVLESIMKEVQNLFTSSLTVPGFETVDQASETVRHVVDRVRERMAVTTNEASRTTAALRGVTTDLLKEIMVQEAVIETLWAVIRDTQVRPWITNEHQALQSATTKAVTAYLSRMQDRMRFAGFSEDEIGRLLPRTRTCGREGPSGMFDTCPERNMGKKRRGGGYGSSAYRSYGYGYQSYPSYYSQPMYYSQPSYYSEPMYSSYSSYPAYYEPYYGYGSYRRGFHHRRLAEMGEGPVEGEEPNTPPFPLTGFGPFSRFLLEEPMDSGEPMMPPEPMEGPEVRNMGARHGRGYRSSYGYPSYGYGRSYYARPYGRSYYSYGYPSYSYSYPSYSSYSYPSYSYSSYPSYSYPSSYGYRRYPSYGYGPRYMRSIEVPDMDFSDGVMGGGSMGGPEPAPLGPVGRGAPRSPMSEPVPLHGSLRRTGDVRGPLGGPEVPFVEEFEPIELAHAPYESVF